ASALFFARAPDHLYVSVSFDPDESARIAAKFRVVRLQQVMANDGQFEVWGDVPAESRVRRSVAPDHSSRQGANVTIRLVKLQFLSQVHQRLNNPLVVCARSLIDGRARWVVTP